MENDTINQVICSGGLFLAKDTKRFLLLSRTKLNTAGTWGLVGGRKEPSDRTPFDALTREIQEEVGRTPTIKKVVPLELFVSNDQQFQYNTYVLVVDREFIPSLNDEHDGYAWVSYDQWPKPLHRGVKNSFSSKIIRAKIELLLELL